MTIPRVFRRRLRLPHVLMFIATCLAGVPACDSGSGEAKDAEAEDGEAKDGEAKDGEAKDGEAKADDKGAAATKGAEDLGEKIIDQATEEAGAAHLFDPEDKTIRKKSCEFLTADLVSKHFGVPATDLKQFKMMGCMYNHDDDTTLTSAQLMMIRVHKTEDRAKTWFGNATASKTRAEMDAEMEMVKKKVQEREEIDTKLKKKTAGDMADLMKMATPKEGISYDDVAGIGDEARISNADGVMWIRLGNMTFQVAAYQGPMEPKLDIDPKNMQGLAKRAIENQQKWIKDTLPQRKEGAKRIAPDIVKAVAGS